MITAEQVRYYLSYEAETGVFRWLVIPGFPNKVKVGDLAGNVQKRGYRQIKLFGQRYSAHRLAWLYVYGEWPKSDLDHIDRDTRNNRISNLREVTASLNAHNRALIAGSDSKTGILGVVRSRSGKRFVGLIYVDGRRHRLGTFDTAQQAHDTYLVAKRKLYVTARA